MAVEVRGRGKPTLSDVASVAGTSVPTVSKVLRGGTDVSPATRGRVMDAIRAVGYARGLKGQADSEPAALIDLVVNHVNGTWANGVLTGVESAATAANAPSAVRRVIARAIRVASLFRPARHRRLDPGIASRVSPRRRATPRPGRLALARLIGSFNDHRS